MYQSEVAPLRRVLMKHARDAYRAQAAIDAAWEGLDYLDAPRFDEACRESDALAALFEEMGVTVEWMPPSDAGLDSIYVRDASVVSNAGAVLCRMGKAARRPEPELLGRAYAELGIYVRGAVEEPGRLEGGDVVWLTPTWLVVGVGPRTNASGVEQLRALVGTEVEVTEVGLPEVTLPGDVFHLMSAVSPLDEDLLLVDRRLLPAALYRELQARGFRFVEVPQEEVVSQACNVFAVAPAVVVALEGNPVTRARMEQAGVEVHTYDGAEISLKGCGGPTCLTRPLERDVA